MSTHRSYVFTLNNPDEFDPDEFEVDTPGPLGPFLLQIPHFRYCSYQYEIGEACTLHFQGYIELKNPSRITPLKVGPLAYAHFEPRRGTADQAREYTRKPEGSIGGPWEVGQRSGGQGQRTDLRKASEFLLDVRDLRQLAMAYPDTYVKYYGGFTKLLETTRPLPQFRQPDQWRLWQSSLLQLLEKPPHDRRIHWYVDPDGGAGKSFMVRYLGICRGALCLSGARYDRILHAYNGERIVTFDFSRDTANDEYDRTPYGPIEAIKNGNVFSGMYGLPSRLYDIPYIFCFSNFDPDRSKFSGDRWDVHYISKDS